MMLTHLVDQIATPNHIFAQDGVFLEVLGVFGDKGGELQLGSWFPIYNQSFQIIQSENFHNFPVLFFQMQVFWNI